MSPSTAFLLVGGLVLLAVGAEILVRGASRLAALFGVSPLVIGLTVVACGTSSPELAVSLKATLAGSADIAVGNVVGSNIFNVLFIVGLCALILPLRVSAQLVRLDVPLMIAVSALLLLFAADGVVGRGEGFVLVAGVVAYTILAIRLGRREPATTDAETSAAAGTLAAAARRGPALLANIALAAAGLYVLVVGARWFVEAATALARVMGVSDVVIGLTIVAAGTSLPEVATSILASIRGQRDIAIGNVVGSNLYNILAILGVSAVVSPGGLPVAHSMIHFDIPVMTGVAVACLPVLFTHFEIRRWEGALFLLYYIAYTAYLIFAATAHDALESYTLAFRFFLLPLTAVTLVVLAWQARAHARWTRP